MHVNRKSKKKDHAASEDVGVGRSNFRNNYGDSYKEACLTCAIPEYLIVLEAR